MTPQTAGTLRITRHFDFPMERVFDAWLDPAKARRFLFATPTGQMVRVDIDARVGGSFVIVRRDGDDVEHVGTYLEIDRPRRLVFTFSVPKYSKQETRVSIDLKPAGAGCDLTLTHEGVLPEWLEPSRAGWGMILDTLAGQLSNQGGYGVVVEPGTIRFERLLPGPVERVWAYLTDSGKRGQWLAAGDMEPRLGGSVELRFDHAALSAQQAPPPERFKDMGVPVSKEKVTRYEPMKALGLTWGCGGGERSEVLFELKPQGDKVLLVLTHRQLPSHQAIVETSAGWHSHLAVLEERLEGREPRAFWTIFAENDREYAKRLPDA